MLEIDYSTGRTIIDDPWRAIQRRSAIDHGQGVLYVLDAEEPEGVEAMSVAPDGRLYVSGPVRVLEFDPRGEYLGHWTPRLAPRLDGAVCDLGGQPAVPTRNGVVRRGDDGPDEAIGENVVLLSGDPADWETTDEFIDEAWRVQNARILCTPNAAFVVSEYGGMRSGRNLSNPVPKPDSLAVFYYRSNREGRLPIPDGLAADQALTVGPLIETDNRGNIVLLGVSMVTLMGQEGGFWNMGAVIDPESGCHAVIRNPERNMMQPRLLGVYQDSRCGRLSLSRRDDGERAARHHQLQLRQQGGAPPIPQGQRRSLPWDAADGELTCPIPAHAGKLRRPPVRPPIPGVYPRPRGEALSPLRFRTV